MLYFRTYDIRKLFVIVMCVSVNLKCEIILFNHDKSQYMINFCDVNRNS